MSKQLVFELPHRAALEADDFLVSDCNSEAVRLIDAWPDWPSAGHLIIGPAGSGKSHLANVWLLKSGAERIAPDDMKTFDATHRDAPSGVLLENLDRTKFDERALFHLLNLSREQGFGVLFTARQAPANWPVELADLRSRLRSIPIAEIKAPDDGLLQAVLLKQFLDRQLNVDPQVIAFLAARMERSADAVRNLVDAVDRTALSGGRKISRQLAAEVLAQLETGEID